MLSFLAFAMVVTFMTLFITKRLSALVALIIVPVCNNNGGYGTC